ncbi:hypothetical protein CpipJ_CPIJ019846, partial [Culex quinquefasciatus]
TVSSRDARRHKRLCSCRFDGDCCGVSSFICPRKFPQQNKF